MKKLLLSFVLLIMTVAISAQTDKTITVKWKNSLGWSSMNIYSWTASGNLTGAWPGKTVTADADGWYSHTFVGQETVNVIFNGDGDQTVDIKDVTESSCYEIAEGEGFKKRAVTVVDCPAEGLQLAVNPTTGVYPGGTTVSLVATGGVAPIGIYYTTDGTEPTSVSNVYSAPLQITERTTLKAVAIDANNEKSALVNETYYMETPKFTVKWKLNEATAWGTEMNVYAYPANGEDPVYAWPGALVTADEKGWYSYEFTAITVNLVFNDVPGALQTSDVLGVSSDICYEIMQGDSHYAQVVDCPVVLSIENEVNDGSQISVYPNPATDVVGIRGIDNVSGISIANLNGIVVKAVSNTYNTLDVSDLPAGLYILTIKTADGGSYYTKLMKK